MARETNKDFSESPVFQAMARTVWPNIGTKFDNRQHKHLPLTRQASKFRRGKGIVYMAVYKTQKG
jgi:hypothetical protein